MWSVAAAPRSFVAALHSSPSFTHTFTCVKPVPSSTSMKTFVERSSLLRTAATNLTMWRARPSFSESSLPPLGSLSALRIILIVTGIRVCSS